MPRNRGLRFASSPTRTPGSLQLRLTGREQPAEPETSKYWEGLLILKHRIDVGIAHRGASMQLVKCQMPTGSAAWRATSYFQALRYKRLQFPRIESRNR